MCLCVFSVLFDSNVYMCDQFGGVFCVCMHLSVFLSAGVCVCVRVRVFVCLSDYVCKPFLLRICNLPWIALALLHVVWASFVISCSRALFDCNVLWGFREW